MKMALSEFVLREKRYLRHITCHHTDTFRYFLVISISVDTFKGDSLLRTVSLHESTAVDMRSVPG